MSDDYLSEFKPVEIRVVDGRVDEAIHRFRKLVTTERIMSSIKEHYAYEKPSEKRRRKIRESQQRLRKLAYQAEHGADNSCGRNKD